jgi:hypothetical protein
MNLQASIPKNSALPAQIGCSPQLQTVSVGWQALKLPGLQIHLPAEVRCHQVSAEVAVHISGMNVVVLAGSTCVSRQHMPVSMQYMC